MKRPTKAQLQVLRRLREGWALGLNTTFHGKPWLQRDGLGKGGPTERVTHSTLNALHTQELVALKREGFPFREYKLTRKGACSVIKHELEELAKRQPYLTVQEVAHGVALCAELQVIASSTPAPKGSGNG